MKLQKKKTLSRREALKTLVAVTGVAVLSSVRNQWETPLVQVGALPAHAQGSQLATLIVNNETRAQITVALAFVGNLQANTSFAEQKIDIGESGTFTVTPGTYDVFVSPGTIKNCFDPFTRTEELKAGETLVREVGCVD